MRLATALAIALAVCLAPTPLRADLIIANVVDGTLAGGQPKLVEVKNAGTDCEFLGDLQLCYYTNGGTLPTGCLAFGDIFLAAGASITVAFEHPFNKACDPNGQVSCFEYVYGFAPAGFLGNQGNFISGDDVVVLRVETTTEVLDTFGEIGVDGTGTVWEYTNSWARRSSTAEAKPSFSASDWVFGGPHALAGANEATIAALTQPGAYAGCVPSYVSYCTAGTSALGCQATVSATGQASASASSGFSLLASGAEGQKAGGFYFGWNGPQVFAWGNSTSLMCVSSPRFRTTLSTGVGTAGACDGVFVIDLNALWCSTCPKPAKNPGIGTVVDAQCWFRDPSSTSSVTTALSNAIEFTVGP
jgi:hypothetical protein